MRQSLGVTNSENRLGGREAMACQLDLRARVGDRGPGEVAQGFAGRLLRAPTSGRPGRPPTS